MKTPLLKMPMLTDATIAAAIDFALSTNTLSCTKPAKLSIKKFKQDVAKHYYHNIDGYQLTVLMEQSGWRVNAEFVADMTALVRYIIEQLKIEIDQWEQERCNEAVSCL